MRFADRIDAAEQLARALQAWRGRHPLVLAIPRGAGSFWAAVWRPPCAASMHCGAHRRRSAQPPLRYLKPARGPCAIVGAWQRKAAPGKTR